MKANLILKSMLVLLFVCGSAAVTDAEFDADALNSPRFFVIYHLWEGLQVKNDDGLGQYTETYNQGYNPIALTCCFHATLGRTYWLKSGDKEDRIGAALPPEKVLSVLL